MRLRPLAAGAAVLLAGTVLSGCRTTVGTAATVGSVRISESQVNDQVLAAPPAATTSTPAPPKSLVLDTLLREHLLERALAANGGVPSSGDLSAYGRCATNAFLASFGSTGSLAESVQRFGIKGSFASTIVRSARLRCALADRAKVARFEGSGPVIDKIITQALSSAGGQADASAVRAVAVAMATELAKATDGPIGTVVPAALRAAFTKLGINASAEIESALDQALVTGLGGSQFTGITRVILAAHVPISVSPRYGVWNASTLSLSIEGTDGLPSYLTIRPTATPSASPGGVSSPLQRAVEVMDLLRSPGGCPWDAAQTHESLTRYLVEECYEVIEAIESGDAALLREELGDLLLQVLFHARIAQEMTPGFDIQDVASELVDKLVRRHPHVFGGEDAGTAEELNESWERRKIAEKGRTSALEGVPIAQPALALTAKLIDRANRAGLPVPAPDGDAVGARLFAIVAEAVAMGIDPETALRSTARGYREAIRAAENTA